MNAKKKEKENFTAELIRELEGLKSISLDGKKHRCDSEFCMGWHEHQEAIDKHIDARIKKLTQQEGV